MSDIVTFVKMFWQRPAIVLRRLTLDGDMVVTLHRRSVIVWQPILRQIYVPKFSYF